MNPIGIPIKILVRTFIKTDSDFRLISYKSSSWTTVYEILSVMIDILLRFKDGI